MSSVERAIILAAGRGSRMMPLTKNTPKPLIKVFGEPIIEHTIKILKKKHIDDIHIVVGYLADEFKYLCEKYNVKLIHNPLYNTCNNISSLYVVREHLKNSVILDGDIWINDEAVIRTEFDYSGYTSVWTSEFSEEWIQCVDDDGFLQRCSRTGGDNGWVLYSVSYWNEEDAIKLKYDIEKEFCEKNNTDIYWDDVAIFCYPEKYKLKIKKVSSDSLVEFDSVSELASFDKKYLEVKNEQ